MTRIGLLGGSFDPPHLGHVLAATWAMAVGDLDGIWVEPARVHPYSKDLSPWEQRLALCRLAFADLPFVEVRQDEMDNPDGFTIDLIGLIEEKRPGTTWVLIGGSDTVDDLVHWKDGARLAHLVEVLPVPRRGFDDDPRALPAIASSAVRTAAAKGEDISKFLPRKVFEAIRSSGWYGVSG